MSNQDDSELKPNNSDVLSTERKEETGSAPEQKIENSAALIDALEEARKKSAENWDLFLRTRADADNLRRRALIDVENAHKYGIEKFARDLLGVIDSLEHGLAALITDNGEALKEGLKLTQKLLLDTFEKYGIRPIHPVGESFDPKLHEALTTQVSLELEPNKVVSVVQKGYTLQDRLLRPARVIVSRVE